MLTNMGIISERYKKCCHWTEPSVLRLVNVWIRKASRPLGARGLLSPINQTERDASCRQVGASALCCTRRGRPALLFMLVQEDLSLSNKAVIIFSPSSLGVVFMRGFDSCAHHHLLAGKIRDIWLFRLSDMTNSWRWRCEIISTTASEMNQGSG